jgi:PEP-CTERM motif
VRRHVVALIGVLAVVGAAAALVASKRSNVQSDERFERISSPVSPTAGTSAPPQEEVRSSARPLYRHSVVPGGVQSAGEVLAAVRRDALVAAHYRAVNIRALRVEKLARPQAMFVSYRRGNRIYWTKHRVHLQAGETVLTDGRTTIRARCGNCISADAQAPVAPTDEEASEQELDQLIGPDAPADDAGSPVAGALNESALLPARPLALTAFRSPAGPIIGGGPGSGGPASAPSQGRTSHAIQPFAGGIAVPGPTAVSPADGDVSDPPGDPGNGSSTSIPRGPSAPTPGTQSILVTSGPEPHDTPTDDPWDPEEPTHGGTHPVPEPSTLLLVGSGMGALALRRRAIRRKR